MMPAHKEEICNIPGHERCIVSEPYGDQWRIMHICKHDSTERTERFAYLQEHYKSFYEISHRLVCGACGASEEIYGSDG